MTAAPYIAPPLATVPAPAAHEAPAVSNTAPLTGAALQAKVGELLAAGTSQADTAVACGYYIIVDKGARAGEVRAAINKLNQALLEAQGLVFAATSRSNGEAPMRSSKHYAVVNKTGRASLPAVMLDGFAAPGDVLNARIADGMLVLTVRHEQGTLAG